MSTNTAARATDIAQSARLGSDYWRLPARALAQLISRGEISTGEAVQSHMGCIEEVNPLLNAVVVKRYDEALAEVREADAALRRGDRIGPLHGAEPTQVMSA